MMENKRIGTGFFKSIELEGKEKDFYIIYNFIDKTLHSHNAIRYNPVIEELKRKLKFTKEEDLLKLRNIKFIIFENKGGLHKLWISSKSINPNNIFVYLL